MNKHDLTFMKHFAQLILGLMVLAILLILGAMHIYGSQPREENKAIIAATNAYPGVTGAITLDDKRNATKPAVVLEIKGGKKVFNTQIAP